MNYLDVHLIRRAAYPRAMLETGTLALLLAGLFLLTRKPDSINLPSLALGLGLPAPAWLALRTRLPCPADSRMKQIAAEGLRSLGLGAVLAGVSGLITWVYYPLLAANYSLLSLWLASAGGSILLAGLAHLGLRAGLRFWIYWQAARRRKLALALTHAQLGLVILGVGGLTALVALAGLADAYAISRSAPTSFFPLFARELDKIVMTNSLILLLACPVVLVLLGFLFVFSSLFTRSTTRRLKQLALAADALRHKDYTVRVAVDGEDEVARVQASFNHMAGELTSALGNLQAERDRVSRLLAERRELFASVSHELRTPLAVLRAAQEALAGRPGLTEDAQAAHELEIIQHQVGRLQSELDDLFLLSRAEVERLEIHFSAFDLNTLAAKVVDPFIRLAWAGSRVEVVFQGGDGALTIWADPNRLEQALANLLRNALRYTPPGGVVVVQTQRLEGCARLSVRDTGSGIAPLDLPHIWTSYYRVPGQPQDSPELNAGLGLPLVKEFVQAMGGSVSVESQVGEGSCFSMDLRLVDDTLLESIRRLVEPL
jgi:signal transduction histidine kinase